MILMSFGRFGYELANKYRVKQEAALGIVPWSDATIGSQVEGRALGKTLPKNEQQHSQVKKAL